MTLQNRVTPFGEIVADPARGLFMGNRGILHDGERRLGTARWRHPHWIVCTLEPRDEARIPMTPGRYTELFFLDEAVALAAGHRPCAECRRSDHLRFKTAWRKGHEQGEGPSAPSMDRALHEARLGTDRRQKTIARPWQSLPDGSFVGEGATAWIVLGEWRFCWSPGGYDGSEPRPVSGLADVLTPAPTLAALTNGYRPVVHPTASRGGTLRAVRGH